MTDQSSSKNTFAAGGSAVAAIVLIGLGALQFFQGIAALANDELFVVGIDYVYRLDLTTWGWIHLILGLLVAIVGFALIYGATWSRIVAVVLVVAVDRGELPVRSVLPAQIARAAMAMRTTDHHGDCGVEPGAVIEGGDARPQVAVVQPCRLLGEQRVVAGPGQRQLP